MKPRTAVAAHIMAALNDIDTDELEANAEDHKKNGKALNSKEKARVATILDFYTDVIGNALANTPFEGDTAEVEGYPTGQTTATEADVDTTTGDPGAGNGLPDGAVALGAVFDLLGRGGNEAVHIHIGNLNIVNPS